MADYDAHAWHRTNVGILLPPAGTQHPLYSLPCPQSLHPSGNTLPSIMLYGCQDQTCTRSTNAACIPPVRITFTSQLFPHPRQPYCIPLGGVLERALGLSVAEFRNQIWIVRDCSLPQVSILPPRQAIATQQRRAQSSHQRLEVCQ